jgi:photosystem II stability/assembly factor-like uncharacterized protein
MKNILVLTVFLTLTVMQTIRSQSNWTHVGPKSDNQSNGNGFETSRLEDITFDPNNPNHMFASGLLAGLWESMDGGDTWDYIPSEVIGTSGVGDVAFWNNHEILVANSHFLYADINGGPHIEFSTGIWRYDFMAQTWQALNPFGVGLPSYHIRTLAVKNGVIYACTTIGLFISTDAGNTWSQPVGGFIENIVFIDGPGVPAYYCFIAGSDMPGNQTQPVGKLRLMESTDGGQSFTDLSPHLATSDVRSHGIICAAPTQGNTARLFLYTIANSASGNAERNYIQTFTKDVLNNAIALSSYQNMNTTGNPAFFYAYIPDRLAIEYDPVNDGVWYGGTKLAFKDVTPGTANNNSGGACCWNDFHSQNGVHDDIHDIKLLPGTNRLYVASDGGLIEMTLLPPVSQGATPQVTYKLKNQGLNVCLINGFSGTDADPNLYVIGAQDIVNSDVYDAALGKNIYTHQTWENDGALIDKFSTQKMFFDISSYSHWYATSENGGQTLSPYKRFYEPKYSPHPTFEPNYLNENTYPTDGFTTRLFFQDPFRPGRIFFVKQRAGISQYHYNPGNPAQSAFTRKIDTGSPLFNQFGIHGWAMPKAISFSPQTVNSLHLVINGFIDNQLITSRPSVIKYIGNDLENCWVTHYHDVDAANQTQWANLTATLWENAHTLGICATPITTSGLGADMYGIQFKEIETSPWNKDVIYVLLMVPHHPDIKILKYDGVQWTNYGQGIPNDEYVYSMILDYQSNDGIYLSTDKGVYYRDASMNNGWTPFRNNMPMIFSKQMEINYTENTVRAGTFGQGIWKSNLNCPTGPLVFSCQNCNGPSDYFREGTSVTATQTVLSSDKMIVRATEQIELISGGTFSLLDPSSHTDNHYQLFIHGCGPGQGNTYRPDKLKEESASREPEESKRKLASNILIFPNPTSGSFTVEDDWENEKDVMVYDATGKPVFQQFGTTERRHSIDLSGYPKGVYVVVISDGVHTVVRKLLVSQ